MADDRLHHGWTEAPAERAADAGWEPPDWAPILRARRRRELLVVAALVVGTVASLVVRLVVREKPLAVETWFWLASLLVYVVVVIRGRVTSAGRAEWLQGTRREVRMEHALRHHVSIGATDRPLVTERAGKIDSWAPAHFVGWPVLGVLVFAMLQSASDLPLWQDVVAGLLVALVCTALVLWARRRVDRARRWLADPLPRTEDAP